MPNRKKYNPTEPELQIIRDLYNGTTVKINIIAIRLRNKYPRWMIRKLAGKLGLARVKEPRWNKAEEQYLLDHYPSMGKKKLQAGIMRISGVKRSYNSVWLKIKRLGMVSADGEGFTLRGLCNLFWSGQEQHHIIYRWIQAGWLRGKKRGTLRKASQGGDQWYFAPEWVRNFIITHPEEIDLRLVDSIPFIKLISAENSIKELCLCKCPKCGQQHKMNLFNPGVAMPRVYCPVCKISIENMDVDKQEYDLAVSL